MKKTNNFSPEVRERAVRMVQEQRGECSSLWAAIESIASKIGCVPQTLNEWVKRAEVDAGTHEGVTTAEAQRVKELEREVKELRRASVAPTGTRRGERGSLHSRASDAQAGAARLDAWQGRVHDCR